MNETPSISDAEWQVMNVLWNHPLPMTAGEVVAELSASKSWSPRTVKTMLNRLLKKGALEFEAQGNRYLYQSAVPRARCVRAASRSFLSRVFSGSAGPMLVHLVNHTELSAAEIESLQQLLGEKRTAKSESTTKAGKSRKKAR